MCVVFRFFLKNMFTGRIFIHEKTKLTSACQIMIFMVIVKGCSSSIHGSHWGT